MSFAQPMACLTPTALVALLLVSCTVGSSQQPLPYGDLEQIEPSGQVIVYWHPYTGYREEVLLALLDEFNLTNPWGITVLGESAASLDALYRAVEERVEAGPLPDLSIAEPHQVAAYAARQALVELTPYADHPLWGLRRSEEEDFVHTTALPQFEGRYSFPASRAIELLYYNEDLLYELGYTEPPGTWEAFQEMACAASAAGSGTHGYALSVDAGTLVDMFANHGGQMLEEGALGYAFGNDSGLETLSWVQSLVDQGCATWVMERHGDRSGFGAGRTLFIIDSITGLPYVRDAVAAGAGFDWSIVPLPTTMETPRVSIFGLDYVVLRTTPERQLAAWLFVKWMSEPQQQARWVRAIHTLPTRASTADLLADYLQQNPRYGLGLDLLQFELLAEPAVTGYGDCRAGLENLLRAVVEGADPAAELVQTLRACNESLGE